MYLSFPLLIISVIFSMPAWAENRYIANFAQEDLSKWESKSFVGHTQYQIVTENNATFLKAYADNSASGIAKELTVDLKQTPFINWSWKVENLLAGLDETRKAGDDYVARLYIVKSGGLLIWKTKALNYVWSSNQIKGTSWNNAYAGGNAKMLALRSPKDPVDQWVSEKRNVYQDMIQLFGDKGSQEANEDAYRYIDVVAIMSDTDDSKRQATAYYGDIYFSDK